MKKVWLLAMCSTMIFTGVFAGPVSAEDEIVIEASPSALPNIQAPEIALLPTDDVELSTEAPLAETPLIQDQAVAVPAPKIVQQIALDPEEDIAALEKEEKEVAEEVKSGGIVIDLGQVFAGSPTIYSVLFILSIASVGIWAYALLSLRSSELLPEEEYEELKNHLHSHRYDIALDTCKNNPTLLFGMVATAIKNRHQGSAAMLEMMKSEGRRMSISFWQKINLLNEIAIIAPMLGLLGTVLGMFYAFYDLNRSAESISALFDGLGISVGTTVGGLVVAILALMFHAMTKYRLVKQLTLVEAKAEALAQSIKDNQ
jgi:biopolymer transport protein ExbB